ncbi:MAG: metallophosphatase domain-containing protein [Dysgonamonadaceae bacterium]|jgi:Icc-related predicted phosphoesterase|nr:metallophosphatase domain-containing protein [Dysgonamonadaceae bacterium]
MRILHISDTHNQHHLLHDLPDADIIVHSGDMSENGTEDEVLDFLNWFEKLPYTYKIFIAGNHDTCLCGESIEGLSANCFYLCNSEVVIEGVKFYGMPLFMEDILSGEYNKNIRKIPKDVDVLITHHPPYGILDFADGSNFGCLNLLQFVSKNSPKYHLFGHVHANYGMAKSRQTTFVNASVLGVNYQLSNKPVLLEL